jgi:hypothetical protein
VLIAVCGIAAATLITGGASAKVRAISGIHDARYCEILELKGSPPDAKVVVWNTLGLNDCPRAKWDPLDASELADKLGATLVILNGPRHFLMDAASGRTGRVERFGGLRMRRVAAIPISSPAELVRTAYTERTIARTNDWRWKKRRWVFELLAPDGANYLMQSYSQELDPGLTIRRLKRLGKRLDLPKGWEYRARRLKRGLTLRARGEATIIQDDLQNTYQRLPRKKGDKRESHRVDLEGVTRTTGAPGPGMLEDEGTITGRPFGPGTVDIIVSFGDPGTVTGTFEIDAAKGSAFGTLAMTYTIAAGEIEFTGTASFTGGTGKYRGIRGKDLAATDRNTLDGQNGRLTLKGITRY